MLKLSLEHKQTTLPIEKQKELTAEVLDLVKNERHDAKKILRCKYIYIYIYILIHDLC